MAKLSNQSNRLGDIIGRLASLEHDHGDELMCIALIHKARELLSSALLDNIASEREDAQLAQEERRLVRAENGHPE